jgi:hypothetical protein
MEDGQKTAQQLAHARIYNSNEKASIKTDFLQCEDSHPTGRAIS